MKTNQNEISRYEQYKASMSFCEGLWEHLMRDDAFEIMGRDGWETLRAAYELARDEQTRRFNAWLEQGEETRKRYEKLLSA